MKTLDGAIQESGGFGIFQILFVCFASLFMSLVGANMGASIFVAFAPQTTCKSPFESEAKQICTNSYQELLTPVKDGDVSLCRRYNFTRMDDHLIAKLDNSSCNFRVNTNNTDEVHCDSWAYDDSVMSSTIVTDFDLVCRNRLGGYLSQSALMLGVGIGSIIAGYISDRFGRRHSLLIICIGMSVTGSLLSITKSYLAFSITRGLFGLFAYSPFLVLFVHVLEMTVPKYRSIVAQVTELSFPVGFAYLTLVSYYLRDWRKVQLAITVPSLLGGVIWWLSPESPRWLIMRNRKSDAQEVLRKIARINKAKHETEEHEIEVESVDKNESNSFKLMFKTPSIRSISLRLFYNWFAVSSVYYGLTLNAAELSGDPFTNLLINSAAEVVAVLMTIPLVNFCGRRLTGSFSEILAGIFCILVQMTSNPTASTVLAILGKFAISISFSTMYITAAEIYPTDIRNFATGLCNSMARLGGVVSPLIAMSSMINAELPYILFGLLALFAGLLILSLPETRGVPLPQTIDDGVEFLKNNPGIFDSFKKRCSSSFS